MKIIAPTPEGFAEVADHIRAGGVVAYPTETVYGLAVDPFSARALEALFAVKGRPAGNPVLLIASNLRQVTEVARVSARARMYIDRFWPGPLSLVLPPARAMDEALCSSDGKICVRIPGSEIARNFCDAVGHAITSTSANRSGASAATSPCGIHLDGVSSCIDGGALPPRAASTVFDPDAQEVIREGAIAAAHLKIGMQTE